MKLMMGEGGVFEALAAPPNWKHNLRNSCACSKCAGLAASGGPSRTEKGACSEGQDVGVASLRPGGAHNEALHL